MKAFIKTSELIRVIKALKPFTRKMDPWLKEKKMEYIYAEFNAETQEVRFEALDGHRVAVEYVKCTTEENFSVYIEPFNPWKTEAVQAEIELTGRVAILDMGYYTLKFIQPEGEWYDTKKMISTADESANVSKTGINPNYLMEALKGINLYSTKRPVIIEVRNKIDPVVIRETKDKRNARYILPVNINDYTD